MDKKTQGKRNKAAGQRFELKVRKDLESKGWIVSKWMNNVSDYPDNNINIPPEKREDRKLIPAKHKFRGPGIPMAIGTGFPDFIAFKFNYVRESDDMNPVDWSEFDYGYVILGVEAKSNGFLTKEEKEKMNWLLENNIFSKILIAKKGKKRGEIVYENINIYKF